MSVRGEGGRGEMERGWNMNSERRKGRKNKERKKRGRKRERRKGGKTHGV